MLQPVKSGIDLIREIDQTISLTPTLWWLGHAGFVVRFATVTFYIDPCFSDLEGRPRLMAAPLTGDLVRHADMILVTHAHPGHLDPGTILPMLEASKRAKVLVPRRIASEVSAAGIPLDRTSPTDANLRVEYFQDNLYGRIYAVPSAHPTIEQSPTAGHACLGYIIRFGRWNIYHAGDCCPYPGLADRLRPYNINVALLPVGGKNFSVNQAAQLAADIGATWIIPMHYGTFEEDRESVFVTHMLGHRPEQRFRTLQCGQKWALPED